MLLTKVSRTLIQSTTTIANQTESPYVFAFRLLPCEDSPSVPNFVCGQSYLLLSLARWIINTRICLPSTPQRSSKGGTVGPPGSTPPEGTGFANRHTLTLYTIWYHDRPAMECSSIFCNPLLHFHPPIQDPMGNSSNTLLFGL